MLRPVDSEGAIIDSSPNTVSAVDFRALPPGTELIVETCNTQYRLEILDDRWNAQVQGGRYFNEATTARLDGCTAGGCQLKIGWIAIGCCLELTHRGRRIVTSRVQSISFNHALAA
jgi:hypothetical protein